MIKLDDVDVLKLVPEFMRNDAAVQGLAAAVNSLIKAPGARIKTARVWDQIDRLTAPSSTSSRMSLTSTGTTKICRSKISGRL